MIQLVHRVHAACDHVDLCTNVTSPAVLVDTSPPLIGEILITMTSGQLQKEEENEFTVR